MIGTIEFKDTEADLTVLNQIFEELDEKGVSREDATANVLAFMAQQAISQGADPGEARDAFFQAMMAFQNKPGEEQPAPRKNALTQKQLTDLKLNIQLLKNFLMYWDMILCTEIQRIAFSVISEMKELGLYRHELKKRANKLRDEATLQQMTAKGNDRSKVVLWCRRIDVRDTYTREFFEDGGSIVTKFVLGFYEKFGKQWEVVQFDCRNAAKVMKVKYPGLIEKLLELDAMTNTGIELYDTCVKKIKTLTAGYGKVSITRRTHHESMRSAVHNLMRSLGEGSKPLPETERKYARQHLFDLQVSMAEDSTNDFFQSYFHSLSDDFIVYMMAWMRIDMEFDKLKYGAIRNVYYRLGDRKSVRRFFKELSKVPIPEGNVDVFDVSAAILEYKGKSPQMEKFKRMCRENKQVVVEEPEELQDHRMLRTLARRNNMMLPDDILRVMVMKHGTKKAMMEQLSGAGFELAPTLRRVRKMRLTELKHL